MLATILITALVFAVLYAAVAYPALRKRFREGRQVKYMDPHDRLREGTIADARLGMTGIDDTAKRANEAEALLAGRKLTPELIEAAVAAVRAGVNPPTDLRASADYRRHLVGVLAGRALADAWRRAGGEKS